ncbi:Coenzyme F420 hydrogenase/dehydrogenase, beta subunit C-terminal domain [Chloroflexota bacterium]
MTDKKFKLDDLMLRAANKLMGTPDEQTIRRYLGQYEACYLGYASNEKVRSRAASGGLVSAILIHLLENEIVQGALISHIVVRNSQIMAEPFIARTKQDILNSQSSIYMKVPIMSQFRHLSEIEGDLAVVALPCELKVLRQYETRNPKLAEKIKLRIALVCARNSTKQLLSKVLIKKEICENDVTDMRFRQGHWRGHMQIQINDGQEISFPFQDFSIYRNLHFECEMKCLYCEDPLGEYADITCGDAWIPELKKHVIKHSIAVARNTQTVNIIDRMIQEDHLAMEKISPTLFFEAQRRTIIPMKRGKPAKTKLSSLFGYKMKYKGSFRSQWNDYIVAVMILLNYRITQSKSLNRFIFLTPKPILRIFLLAMSFFKNF